MWCELVEEGADLAPDGFLAALGGLAEQVFELCEDLFDGVEVGRVWGKEEQPCPGAPDGGADGGSLVAAEVVQMRRIRK